MKTTADERAERMLLEFARRGVELVRQEDPEPYGLLEGEYRSGAMPSRGRGWTRDRRP